MKIRFAGSSHVGMKRQANEDNFFLLGKENLYVVADGMGGHSSGEVASQIAVEALANFFVDTSRDTEITWPFREDKALGYDENRLMTGIRLSNRRVFEMAQSDLRFRGMGTTIVGMSCGSEGALFGHVGDSRGYCIREDGIFQLTEDHSLLNDYMKVHALTPEEIEAFPHKNVIVRALGMKDDVAVDLIPVIPRVNDIYLLCSDGLSGMISDEVIWSSVRENRDDLEKACQDLIAKANAAGGTDNVTAVLVGFYSDS